MHARQLYRLFKAAIICGPLIYSAPLKSQEPTLLKTLKGHTTEALSVEFSPDGKTLVSAGTDNNNFNIEIKFWDVASGKNTTTLQGTGDERWCFAALSPDGHTVASGSGGNKIKLWDTANGTSKTILDGSSQWASPKVVFSSNGKMLATGGRCINDIKLWEVATGKNIATLKGHDAYGTLAFAFSPNGETLSSLGVHDGLKRWEVATGRSTLAEPVEDDSSIITCAAFSSDAKSLASGGLGDDGGELKFWNILSGKTTATQKVDTSHAHLCSVAFSPDARTLALGSEDGNIKLWKVDSGKEEFSFSGHAGVVFSMAFSPDGKSLASSGGDNTIKLWNMATRK